MVWFKLDTECSVVCLFDQRCLLHEVTGPWSGLVLCYRRNRRWLVYTDNKRKYTEFSPVACFILQNVSNLYIFIIVSICKIFWLNKLKIYVFFFN